MSKDKCPHCGKEIDVVLSAPKLPTPIEPMIGIAIDENTVELTNGLQNPDPKTHPYVKEVPVPVPHNGQVTLTGAKARANEFPTINTGPRGTYAHRKATAPREQHNIGNTDLAYAIIVKALQEHGEVYSMDVSEALPGEVEAGASVVSRVVRLMLRGYGDQIRKTRTKRPGHRICNVLVLGDNAKAESIIWKDWAELSSCSIAEDSPASSE